VFRENLDRRIALGMVAIVAGAAVLSIPSGASFASPWPALAILAARLCWGLDDNLTRTVSLNDATWPAAIEGGVAGPASLIIALAFGARLLGLHQIGAATVIGLFAYRISLTLLIAGMRHVGTARASAYYSIAQFFGAILAEAPRVCCRFYTGAGSRLRAA
jgi:drug/metabolite transporter (DMT)-like permease